MFIILMVIAKSIFSLFLTSMDLCVISLFSVLLKPIPFQFHLFMFKVIAITAIILILITYLLVPFMYTVAILLHSKLITVQKYQEIGI